MGKRPLGKTQRPPGLGQRALEINFPTEPFKRAVADYTYLLDHGYPEKESLKLVGNRYRLSGLQRRVLYRGIAPTATAAERKTKLIPLTKESIKDKTLYIDGYNVLFTIMNYLLGKTLFLSTDGFLRDVGERYGKISDETFLYRAINMLFSFLAANPVQRVEVYLDGPAFNSRVHQKEMEKRLKELKKSGAVYLVKHADSHLMEKNDGVVATSDSEIIDSVGGDFTDLARHILESQYAHSLALTTL